MTRPETYTVTASEMTLVIVALNTRIDELEAEIRKLSAIKKPTACTGQRICYRHIELIKVTALRDMMRDGKTYEPTLPASLWEDMAARLNDRAQAEDDERCARAEAREIARYEECYR